MIGNIYTQSARESWATVPGRSFECVNNANGDPTSITFYQGNNVVFVQYFTYDANNNITKVECKAS